MCVWFWFVIHFESSDREVWDIEKGVRDIEKGVRDIEKGVRDISASQNIVWSKEELI